MKEKYSKRRGKLVRTIPVIVDETMYQQIVDARDNDFNFQEWARDVFTENFETVLEFCKSEKVKHA